MNQAEFEKAIAAAVDEKPTIFYNRIQHLYPREFQKMGKGYETVDSSRTAMKDFLKKKGDSSARNNNGDYLPFLKSL